MSGLDPTTTEYLGDGAYVQKMAYGALRIFAHDGMRATEEVFLEQHEWEALKRFVKNHNMFGETNE